MTCRQFADFLDDYVAGDLQGDALAVFERHLSRCQNCQRYLAHYRAAIDLGRGVLAEMNAPIPADVPEDLVRAIVAARVPDAT